MTTEAQDLVCVPISGAKNGNVRSWSLRCPVCKLLSTSKKTLLRHLQSSLHSKYCCYTCDRVFLHKGALKQHCKKKGHPTAHSFDSTMLESVEDKRLRNRINHQFQILTRSIQSIRQKKIDIEAEEKAFKKRMAVEMEQAEERMEFLKKMFREECTKVEELRKEVLHKVKLNIGGKLFTTTQSTLSKYPTSMLGCMFSGRYSIKDQMDEDGSIFIDRSPKHFEAVLDFLRDNDVFISKDEDPQRCYELEKEANFYGLPDMMEAMKKRNNTTPSKSRFRRTS